METMHENRPAATEDADTPLLRVRDLTIEFPAGRKRWVTAVDRVSFDVNPGESVALVGRIRQDGYIAGGDGADREDGRPHLGRLRRL